MTDRVSTLIAGRRERLERALDRAVEPPMIGPSAPIPDETREYLKSEALDLYWNEIEWEHITDEEAVDGGAIASLTFPGFLAYVRGLLLTEVMPDSLSPANPRPQVVADLIEFLAQRVVELEEAAANGDAEADRAVAELAMTSNLIDQVLYLYHSLSAEEIEKVEAAARA